jgi:hypothetical protein
MRFRVRGGMELVPLAGPLVGDGCRDVLGYEVHVDEWCFDRSDPAVVLGCTYRTVCPDAFLCGRPAPDEPAFVVSGCLPDGWEECEEEPGDVLDCVEHGGGGEGGMPAHAG